MQKYCIFIVSTCCSLILCFSNDNFQTLSNSQLIVFRKYHYNEFNKAVFEDTPTRYHEKIRPGQAQMICASFSPGGIFFCVGSADHNVRVYKMDCSDGPQRILEDDSHSGIGSLKYFDFP